MKYLFLFFLILAWFGSAFAQHPAINNLHLKWGVIENNYNNKPQSLSELTFITKSGFALPSKGWKLYFNFAEPIVANTATGGINIIHINGDLFYLSPAADFKGINKNDSLKVQFVALNWLINVTDAPQGFYLIWDKEPAKYYTVNNFTLKPSVTDNQLSRSPLDKVKPTTPLSVFEQNRSISSVPEDSLLKILPTPKTYQLNGHQFKLDKNVNIIADKLFFTESAYFKKELAKLLLPVSGLSKNTINLVNKPMPDEAYEMEVTGNRITIAASSGAGMFYGMQSLKILISPIAYRSAQPFVMVPGVKITDQPRFGYRAVMLDVARNFQPKKEILKLLDVMGLYKLNVLHFHLTDDEGWRLEIPSLPELTTIGAKRGHTLDNKQNLQPSFGSGPYTGNGSGSGFYSKADFIQILKYANQLHIKIIPEIETPGHARAAIKAMDARYGNYAALGKTAEASRFLLHHQKDSSKYTSVQYWNDNVIDVSLPSAYNFIETITQEVKKMYAEAGAPLQTIHFGGDEVPAGVWERSPAYLSLMKTDTAIKSTDDLWAYYYSNVNGILKQNNLYLTAWEEVGTHKVMQNRKKTAVINPALANNNIHLDVWNNVLGWGAEDLAYKLANSGYKVILSNVTNLYFDMAYNKAFDEPGYYWGGYADVTNSYRFIPYDYFKNSFTDRLGGAINPVAFLNKEKLTPVGKENIIGLQGALWGENLTDTRQLEYLLLPKLLGLAERAWSPDPDWATEKDTVKSKALYNESWIKFVNLLGKRELQRLTWYAGGFKYRIPGVGAMLSNRLVTANTELHGFEIHYTTNGSQPTVYSPVYTKPISQKGIIKLGLFNPEGRGSKIITVNNN